MAEPVRRLCGISVVKWSLFFTNFLSLIVGISFATVGGYTSMKTFSGEFDALDAMARALLAVGLYVQIGEVPKFQSSSSVSLLAIISILGCFGAACNSRRALILYTVAVGILILATLAVSIAAFVMSSRADKTSQQFWDKCDRATKDTIETQLDCCGYETVLDDLQCPIAPKTTSCKDMLTLYVSKLLTIIAVSALVLSFIELLAVAFSILIRRKRVIFHRF